MKKILIFIFCCVIAGNVFAAGGSASDGSDSAIYVTVPKAVGFNWFNRMEEGVVRFAEDTGINAYQQGPSQFDVALQIQVLEDLIAQQVDVLAVVPFQPDTLVPVLQKATKQGITVITHEAPNFESALWDVEPFLNDSYGEHLMEVLAGFMGESGKYALYVGSLNSSTHRTWVDSALAFQIANYPNMEWIGDYIETGDDSKVSYEKTKELLKKYPDLKGFQGSSAVDVVGIGQAVEEGGITDSTYVVGTSIVSYAGELLQTGAIDFISAWDPADSGYAMNAVAKLVLDGTPIVKGMDLGINGYESIDIDGNTIYGSAWIDVTAENMGDYDF